MDQSIAFRPSVGLRRILWARPVQAYIGGALVDVPGHFGVLDSKGISEREGDGYIARNKRRGHFFLPSLPPHFISLAVSRIVRAAPFTSLPSPDTSILPPRSHCPLRSYSWPSPLTHPLPTTHAHVSLPKEYRLPTPNQNPSPFATLESTD